jgi:4,5-DOPA dioxygenase extradiol
VRLPALFVAHGAPTLGVDARKGAPLRALGETLPRARAIVAISAHFEAPAPTVATPPAARPIMYDFGGFPEAERARYAPPPVPRDIIDAVAARIEGATIIERPLDHGVWTPLVHLRPRADVPVLQVALPRHAPWADLLELGRALRPLRDEGLLLLGSGNLVHNLERLDWSDSLPPPCWADDVDHFLATALSAWDLDALVEAPGRAPGFGLAHPTDEHARPLVVIAGAGWPGEPVTFPMSGFEFGNLSRRCVQVGALEGP